MSKEKLKKLKKLISDKAYIAAAIERIADDLVKRILKGRLVD